MWRWGGEGSGAGRRKRLTRTRNHPRFLKRETSRRIVERTEAKENICKISEKQKLLVVADSSNPIGFRSKMINFKTSLAYAASSRLAWAKGFHVKTFLAALSHDT